MKGIIALDIDGTLTAEHHSIEPDVVAYLSSLVEQGWKLIFITGRTFQWGYSVLRFLPFPYYAAVQNGAIILQMPERQIILKKYLDKSVLPAMEHICKEEPTDFVIYSGFEYQDQCFYRPVHFSKELLHYVEARVRTLEETWIPVISFEELRFQSFPSLKCFGDLASAKRLAQAMEEQLDLHVPVIKDPFQENRFVVQATHPEVDKGQALEDFKAFIEYSGITIAAGDDNNDIPMLEKADIRIVMATASDELKKRAHVIAPSAEEKGIIQGLQKALHA
jgi:Cof subfamily protein (haloacid dehalogenase superfamily)